MNTTAKEAGCPQDAPSVEEGDDVVHYVRADYSGFLDWITEAVGHGNAIASCVGRMIRGRFAPGRWDLVTCPECRGRGA